MEDLFHCDLQASDEVTMSRWTARPWRLRVTEWAAQKLEFLL